MDNKKQEIPVKFQFTGDYNSTKEVEALLKESGRGEGERRNQFMTKLSKKVMLDIRNLSDFEPEKYKMLLHNAMRGMSSQFGIGVDLRGKTNEILCVIELVVTHRDDDGITFGMTLHLSTLDECREAITNGDLGGNVKS